MSRHPAWLPGVADDTETPRTPRAEPQCVWTGPRSRLRRGRFGAWRAAEGLGLGTPAAERHEGREFDAALGAPTVPVKDVASVRPGAFEMLARDGCRRFLKWPHFPSGSSAFTTRSTLQTHKRCLKAVECLKFHRRDISNPGPGFVMLDRKLTCALIATVSSEMNRTVSAFRAKNAAKNELHGGREALLDVACICARCLRGARAPFLHCM